MAKKKKKKNKTENRADHCQRVYLKARVSTLWPWTKSGPLAVFINKGLLGHRHKNVFVCCLGCIYATRTKLSSYGRDCLTEPEIFTIWTFTEKVC